MATKPPLTLEEQTAKAKLRALAQGVQIWKLEGAEIPQYRSQHRYGRHRLPADCPRRRLRGHHLHLPWSRQPWDL